MLKKNESPFGLQARDIVEFIAPASKFNPECFLEIEALLKSWGLLPKFSCPFSQEEWLCTTDVQRRAEVVTKALHDPKVKALWVVHGGYGCGHLLPYLSQIEKPKAPKLLIGFSDTTMLHLFFNQVWDWPTLHAPSARQCGLKKVSDHSLEMLREWIFGKAPGEIKLKKINSISLENRLVKVVGGNLSLVTSSLGTPWQIKTENRLLFFEEIGERPYKIDRMLTQLQQAGLFKNALGIIWGDFLQRTSLQCDFDTKKLLQEWIQKIPLPSYTYPSGHGIENHPLPLNFPLEIHAI